MLGSSGRGVTVASGAGFAFAVWHDEQSGWTTTYVCARPGHDFTDMMGTGAAESTLFVEATTLGTPVDAMGELIAEPPQVPHR